MGYSLHSFLRKSSFLGPLLLLSITFIIVGIIASYEDENSCISGDVRALRRDNQVNEAGKSTVLNSVKPVESAAAQRELKVKVSDASLGVDVDGETANQFAAGRTKNYDRVGITSTSNAARHTDPVSASGISYSGLHHRLMNEAYSEALKSSEPWRSLLAVAREYHSRGNKRDAREVLLVAEKLAIKPHDPNYSSASIREVIKTMLVMKLSDDAHHALQNIVTHRERELVMAEVSAWSARSGDVGTAKNLVSGIVNPIGRDIALVAIAESEASYEGASKAMQTVVMITNKRKKDDAYRRIAMKLAALRDFSGAEHSAALIRNHRIMDSTKASLARIRARSGDLNGGLQMLRNIGNTHIEDSVLKELSSELARVGRFSDSNLVVSRIRDEKEKSHAIGIVSVEQAKVGNLSAALVNLSSIPVEALRDRGLRYVSATTAHNGEPTRAYNVALRIESDHERDIAYRSIAQAAAGDGAHHLAYNTMQSISRMDEKALALVSMARYRLRQGDDRQAFTLLEDARRSISRITSAHAKDKVRADLALVYAESDDTGKSLPLAKAIANPRLRDTALGKLAYTLATNNDIYTAQQSTQAIATDSVRVIAEDRVASAAARRIKPHRALKASRMLGSGRQRTIFLLAVSRKS